MIKAELRVMVQRAASAARRAGLSVTGLKGGWKGYRFVFPDRHVA
jgi:hypothetical protein